MKDLSILPHKTARPPRARCLQRQLLCLLQCRLRQPQLFLQPRWNKRGYLARERVHRLAAALVLRALQQRQNPRILTSGRWLNQLTTRRYHPQPCLQLLSARPNLKYKLQTPSIASHSRRVPDPHSRHLARSSPSLVRARRKMTGLRQVPSLIHLTMTMTTGLAEVVLSSWQAYCLGPWHLHDL